MANRNEYYKKYYEKTKENLLIKCREKVMCNICNKEVNLSSMTRHNKSKIHMILEHNKNLDDNNNSTNNELKK